MPALTSLRIVWSCLTRTRCFYLDPCPLAAISHAPRGLATGLAMAATTAPAGGMLAAAEVSSGARIRPPTPWQMAAAEAEANARVSERLATLAGTSHWAASAFTRFACMWASALTRRACANAEDCPSVELGLTQCDAQVGSVEGDQISCHRSVALSPCHADGARGDAWWQARPKPALRLLCSTPYNKYASMWR